MKKLALVICFVLLIGMLCMPVGAEQEYELLENGDFEEFSGTWQKYYLAAVDYTDTAHTGSGALKITGRKHSTDVARQYITKPLEYYGAGLYEISAWVRLADPEAAPIDMMVAIGVYCKSGEKHWFTSAWVRVTSDWTYISAQTNISWQGELESAEFYLVSPQNGEEDQTENYRDLLLDDCSMKALSYAGEPYAPPTQAPATTEPQTDAPDISAPESVTTESTEQTAAPESTAPESEIAPEESTSPEDGQSKGEISAQTWVIAGTMAAAALILLCCGIALSVSYARGKRNEAGK